MKEDDKNNYSNEPLYDPYENTQKKKLLFQQMYIPKVKMINLKVINKNINIFVYRRKFLFKTN